MTRDEAFLKSAHIDPASAPAQTWMEWRDSEIAAMRTLCVTLDRAADQERREKQQWRAAAILAGLFALMLLMQPIIERWTR